MRASEFLNEDEPIRIKLNNNDAARAFIQKVYAKYPQTMQNNHVMVWGSGDDQQFAIFELTPSFSKRSAVEVKWFQAYPLRQGVGSRAMKELQTLAREDGIALTLFPWDKGQVSQSKLTKFYKGHGFTPTVKGGKAMKWDPAVDEAMDQGTRWVGDEPYRQLVELDLEEGWKDLAVGAAMGLGALGAHGDAQAKEKETFIQPKHKVAQAAMSPAAKFDATKIQAKAPEVKAAAATIDPKAEGLLYNAGKAAGMRGSELAQFLAQVKHESWNFSRLQEKPQPKVKNYFAKKYDPKFAPKTAKILGNKHNGDGDRYHGRGYIQLTGRDNYRIAGDALNMDLVNHPELAADPANAAKIAVWFWNTRVKPNVSNFDDTTAVTRKINNAGSGLADRHANFIDYKKRIRPA